MAQRNPALSDDIFARETQNSGGGGFDPAWDSPAREVPPGLFEQGGRKEWEQPPAGPVIGQGGPGDTMRIGGTMSATGVLLAILLVFGWIGWNAVTVVTRENPFSGETEVLSRDIPIWVFAGVFVGLGLAILTIFKPKFARITGPLYAAAEGIFLGGISKLYEAQWDGIVPQAVALTVGVFAVMLVLYATGTIKVTNRLRTGIIAATGGVALIYIASLLLRIVGVNVPFIHDSGPVGILFSLVVVGIAAFNLLLDFDIIERGVKMGAPRYMEWYGAFSLVVTLVWLYLEILRLLSKLRSR